MKLTRSRSRMIALASVAPAIAGDSSRSEAADRSTSPSTATTDQLVVLDDVDVYVARVIVHRRSAHPHPGVPTRLRESASRSPARKPPLGESTDDREISLARESSSSDQRRGR